MGTFPILRLLITVLRNVLGCLLTLLVGCWFVVGLPFVLAFRFLVSCFVSMLSSYGKMLAPMDMLMWEEFRGVPHSSLVVAVELDGCVQSCGDIAKLFGCNVVPFYPELSMRIVRVLGFCAFKRYDSFNVLDHVSEVSGDLCIGEIHKSLLNREFSPEKSPWEVVLFNRGSVLGFRVHHCVADGLSVLKLFVERVGGKVLVKAEKRNVDRGVADTFRWWWRVFSGVGIDLFEYGWYTLFGHKEYSARRRGSGGGGGGRRKVVGVCELGCFETVKSVGRCRGVRGSSVILAGILGGLTKFTAQEMGTKLKRLRFGYVLPVAGHPDSLCNHWRTTYSTINVGEIVRKPTTTHQILKQFDKVFVNMKQGSISVLLKYSVLYAGSLVSWIGPHFLKNRVCGVAITNIAGDDEGFSVGGRDCVGFSLSSGGLSGIGIMFCVFTYKRRFTICCVADERVVNEKGVAVLAQYIDREFAEIFKGVGQVGERELGGAFEGDVV